MAKWFQRASTAITLQKLSYLASTGNAEAILGYCQSDDSEVASAAFKALADRRYRGMPAVVEALLQFVDRDFGGRGIEALHTLGAIADKSAIGKLDKLLRSDQRAHTRMAAAHALGKFSSTGPLIDDGSQAACRSLLSGMANDDDPDVIIAIVDALSDLESGQFKVLRADAIRALQHAFESARTDELEAACSTALEALGAQEIVDQSRTARNAKLAGVLAKDLEKLAREYQGLYAVIEAPREVQYYEYEDSKTPSTGWNYNFSGRQRAVELREEIGKAIDRLFRKQLETECPFVEAVLQRIENLSPRNSSVLPCNGPFVYRGESYKFNPEEWNWIRQAGTADLIRRVWKTESYSYEWGADLP